MRQTPRSRCPFATHTTATMHPVEGRAAPLFQKVVQARLRTTAETTRGPAVTTRATAAPGTTTQGLQKGGGGGSPPPPQARPTPGDPRLGGGSDPGKIPRGRGAARPSLRPTAPAELTSRLAARPASSRPPLPPHPPLWQRRGSPSPAAPVRPRRRWPCPRAAHWAAR